MPDTPRLIDKTEDFPDVSDRTPVLAVGSNQSPVQLARKFRGAEWGTIPTSRVHLSDFDTVYSAHITGYGSIAATLHPSVGTRVALYVNWLTSQQLLAMHKTELTSENYSYGKLENIMVDTEAGPSLDSVFLYMGRRGAFAPDGNIIPLAEVPATGRRFLAREQPDILRHVKDHLRVETAFEKFIYKTIESHDVRQSHNEQLARASVKFDSPHFVETPVR